MHVFERTYLGQTSPDGTSLLGAEVKGEVLLVLVELAQVLPRFLVRDSQHASDRLADGVTSIISREGIESAQFENNVHFGELRRRATCNLLYPERQELILELRKLLRQVVLVPRVIIMRS